MTAPVPRFQIGRPMLLAGLRRRHALGELPRTLPAQWTGFAALGSLPHEVRGVAYGAMCGVDQATGSCEYMTAVEVERFDGLPEGLGRMRVPEAHYAVFTHDGCAAGLKALWDAIWTDWLPTSGVRAGDTPDFERYGPDFDRQTRQGRVEIWFPIVDPR